MVIAGRLKTTSPLASEDITMAPGPAGKARGKCGSSSDRGIAGIATLADDLGAEIAALQATNVGKAGRAYPGRLRGAEQTPAAHL